MREVNIQAIQTIAMLSKELKIRDTERYLTPNEGELLTTGK